MDRNQYYEEMMALPEKGTLGDVLARWEQLHIRMQEDRVKTRHLLPEIFLLGAPGIGKSHLLSLIALYLNNTKLLDFQGERKFFEFHLEYCPERETFSELNRFINKLAESAGFRNEFKGIICIELDEWLAHFKEKYFSVFMEYLEEHCDNWLLIFSVNRTEMNVDELIAYLSMYFRLDKVELSLPSSEGYLDHLEKFLLSHTFTLTDNAKKILLDSIDELRKSPFFDGYKSINRLGLDLAYEKYTKEVFNDRQITQSDVAPFSADGDYISAMVKNYQKKQQRIGFAYGGDKDDQQ